MVLNFKGVESSQTITGIPKAHYNSYLSNFENRYKTKDSKFYQKLESIVNWLLTLDLKENPKYVFLCGTAGCGKSHFMVALYRALVHRLGYSQGDGAFFIPFGLLAEEIIGLFPQNIPIRTSLQGYTQARWLFLDDFTSSERVFKQDSLEFTIFRDILIDRYERQNVLVTSSNLDAIDLLPEIDKLFGGYVASRIHASEIIQFPAIDFRKQG